MRVIVPSGEDDSVLDEMTQLEEDLSDSVVEILRGTVKKPGAVDLQVTSTTKKNKSTATAIVLDEDDSGRGGNGTVAEVRHESAVRYFNATLPAVSERKTGEERCLEDEAEKNDGKDGVKTVDLLRRKGLESCGREATPDVGRSAVVVHSSDGSHRKAVAISAGKASIHFDRAAEKDESEVETEKAVGEAEGDGASLKKRTLIFSPSKPVNRKRPPSRCLLYPKDAKRVVAADEELKEVADESVKSEEINLTDDAPVKGDVGSDAEAVPKKRTSKPKPNAPVVCDVGKCRERLMWCVKQGLGVIDLSHMAIADENLEELFLDLVELGASTWALHLNHNRLTKLPDTIGTLKRLAILVVRCNRLTSLPETIGGCERLQELDASQNCIQHLPKSLSSLSMLSSLNLSHNKLSSFLRGDSADKLRSLSVLNLSHNTFVEIASELCRAPLTVFDVSNNLLLGLPESFEMLVSIRKFYVDDNPCINRLPKSIIKANNALAMLTHLSGRR